MSTPDTHILICDDEPDLREMVGEYLEKRGYRVTLAADGEDLTKKLEDDLTETVDVILLDINMPGEDGLSILRRLRVESDVLVIMLTAAGEVVDRIIGLEMGADDYLAKPVDLRELEARIKNVLRRSGRSKQVKSDENPPDTVRFDGLELDLSAATLTGREGEDIPLTAMEYQLLSVFAQAPGRVFNRDQLLETAHERGWDPFDRSIDIRISRLRRKIEIDPTKPKIIRTVRGIGYTFAREG